MEAAPRLPMIHFDLLASPENIQFGPKLKHYIANFYNEDPETYLSEIETIENLRGCAAHPRADVSGVQLLKKYYCQLHFLKSRFPMEEGQACAILFGWKDPQSGSNINFSDIRYELMAVMYNIGALHGLLGAQDSRSNPEGMKMACSHFQCAAWAFETLKEKYGDFVCYLSAIEITHFYKQVCLAQAQECILEKSMLDNRKSTIISKVAVQVWDYYRLSLSALQGVNEELCGRQHYKEWTKYLQFKMAYHRCISLLFQGQQAEELQKMGERVAFYQAAWDHLEEARKFLKGQQQKDLAEALAFTADVVEGKRKAAKNENEFIYHEEVPDLAHLQEVKGASLVKGIEFSVTDPEVSGPDIFSRLVPMEAHEAASLYSEKKAQLLRSVGEQVEIKDQALAEFISSMQLDMLTKMHQATGIPQELIDRAASLSAKTTATQDLIDSMAKLSNIYHDVEANLNEIDILLKEEEDNEKSYQEIMGKRPASIITTDLARESAKYREAHAKANDSNQTLSKAMITHLENLRILQRPIRDLQQKLPSVELPDPNIDENVLQELEMLNAKVEEMRTQRAMLWAQLRESVHNDDITNALVTKTPTQSLDVLFHKELEKHQQLVGLIEHNLAAQDNIKKAFIDCYARALNTRRYIQDLIHKRTSTIQALIASYDSYDDLLAKANKGIEFYTKLEMNVSKLLQRIKSASNVQQEEREQMLAKSVDKKEEVSGAPAASTATGPKLKDYLEARKKNPAVPYSSLNYGAVTQNVTDTQTWPPAVRPAPVGSEVNSDSSVLQKNIDPSYNFNYSQYGYGQTPNQYHSIDQYSNQYPSSTGSHQTMQIQTPLGYSSQNTGYLKGQGYTTNVDDLTNRMSTLLGKQDTSLPISSQYNNQYAYTNYIPQNYTPTSYTYASHNYTDIQAVSSPTNASDSNKANTTTTNSYQTISSHMPNVPHSSSTTTHMQYPDSSLKSGDETGSSGPTQYHTQSETYAQLQETPYLHQTSSQNNSSLPQNLGQSALYQSQNALQYSHHHHTGQNTQSQYEPTGLYPHSQATSQFQSAGHHPQSTGQNYSEQTPGLASGYNLPPVAYSQHSQNLNEINSQKQSSVSQQQTSSDAGVYAHQNSTGIYLQNSVSPNEQNLSQSAKYPGQQHDGSLQAQYSVDNHYYPPGYAPHYSNTAPSPNMYSTTQHPQQYHTQQYASSVAPNVANYSYSTYSAPTNDLYKVQPGSTSAYNMSTGATQDETNSIPISSPNSYESYAYNSYGSAYGSSQPSYACVTTSTYTVPTSSPQVSISAPKTSNTTFKKSNVDLLTGLDFSVSQVPLTPQQNIPEKRKPDDKPSVMEIKTVPTKVKDEPKDDSKANTVRILASKPLSNNEVKSVFNQEVEKYEKYVEALTSKTLSGPTTLDVKWKEIQDSQELDNQKRIISVARCYPMKNRFADILPYDYSRVEIKSSADDYINASHIKGISPFSPQFIVTQAPLPSTFAEFWTMIREQQVELIFCVLNDNEIGDDVYWPREKDKNLSILNMVLSLQSVVVKPNWTERLISIVIPEKKESWVVMHLQFTSWPGSLFPTSPEPFVSYVLELISLFQQQKCTSHPVVVHCSSGIGRSGVMCLLTSAILEVTNQANSIPDLAIYTSKLGNFRKNILRDREHLKFAYDAMLCYIKQVLLQDSMKKKLSELVPVKVEKEHPISDLQEKIIDPLSTLDPFWASKK